MRSITLIAKRAGLTHVITLRPDGHLAAGLSEGAVARRRREKDLAPEAVAEIFRLAAQLDAPPPAGAGGTEDTITLTIQTGTSRPKQFVWAFGAPPPDARLDALLRAIEALRDRELG